MVNFGGCKKCVFVSPRNFSVPLASHFAWQVSGWMSTNILGCLSCWWLNQPIWNILYSPIGSFPPIFGWKIQNIWNHQPSCVFLGVVFKRVTDELTQIGRLVYVSHLLLAPTKLIHRQKHDPETFEPQNSMGFPSLLHLLFPRSLTPFSGAYFINHLHITG